MSAARDDIARRKRSDGVGLVLVIAKEMKARHARVDFGDLVGYGAVGLASAKRRYRAGTGASLSTFCAHRIRGAMVDGIRTMGTWSRSPIRVTFCDPEAAQHVPDGSAPTDAVADLRIRFSRICEAFTCLPEKQRKVMELCYFLDLDLNEAAKQLGLDKSWASRLHSRAIARLREYLSAKDTSR